MPNIASILKAEISRVARKEVRAEIEPSRKHLSRIALQLPNCVAK